MRSKLLLLMQDPEQSFGAPLREHNIPIKNLSSLQTFALFLQCPSHPSRTSSDASSLGSLSCAPKAVAHWRALRAGIILHPICIFCIPFYLINGAGIQSRPESIYFIYTENFCGSLCARGIRRTQDTMHSPAQGEPMNGVGTNASVGV